MAGDRSEVVDANVRVHSQLAHQYNEDEPHFRPENQAKVHARVVDLAARAGNSRLLDLGCGTGFMLHIAADVFDELQGIDATQAMLDRVDTSRGNITVRKGLAESTPFDDGEFDAVTAYSFLHHLYDHRDVLREAFRVLRPGGWIYIDLEPNQRFWESVRSALAAGRDRDPLITREGRELFDIENEMEREHGIAADDFRAAEHIKSAKDGFDPDEFAADLSAVGFADVEVRLDWFLGQGVVHHEVSPEAAELMNAHLTRLRPMSDGLFKYLRAIARKP
jgi:ubiquinone/menaquinone biosynthesis C-methylase UbiE